MQPPVKDIYRQADNLYAGRAELENVRASVSLLHEASSVDYEAGWRLARAHFFLGQEATGETKARAHYARGVKASSRAAKLRGERVEGHFWLGVNLALMAGTEPLPFALFHALRAKKALERAARIDPSYHGAGPLRVLARLQHRLPRLLGGGSARARPNFEQAIRLAPANTVTRIYFAELLIDMGDEAPARAHLEAVLHGPTDPAWNFERDRDRKLAREKLTGMDRMKRQRGSDKS